MRIAVTGGAGFIGSHLCTRLTEDGHEVVSIDDNSTGNNEVEGVETIFADICTGVDFGPVDRVYNLACPASPIQYQKRPVQTLMTCVAGLMNVLKAANGARVLQASTSEVYGDPEIHPQTEGYWGNVNPNGPRACYDEGKRAAETLCREYPNARIARIFNTYGPRMASGDGRAIPNFITQALAGIPITLHGGAQTRSFCYVDDMVDGLITLMESDETRPVNLGNPHEITMRDLVNRIRKLTGSSSPLHLMDRPEDDPERRCPNIQRAMSLGWQPFTHVSEGLSKTIAYFARIDKERSAA